MISDVFIDRPRLASVIAIVTTLAGAIAIAAIPRRAVSGHRAAAGVGDRQLSRRRGVRRRADRGAADRGAGQRRRQDALHEVDERQRRQLHPNRHLRPRHRPRHQHGQRPEPAEPRRAEAARRGKAAGADGQEEVVGPASGDRRCTRRTARTTRCSSATTPPSTSSIRWRASTAWATRTLFGPLDYSMRVWLDPQKLDEPQPDHQRHRGGDPGARTSRQRSAVSARQPIASDQQFQFNLQTKGRLIDAERVRAHRRARQPRRLGRTHRDVARVELGAASRRIPTVASMASPRR